MAVGVGTGRTRWAALAILVAALALVSLGFASSLVDRSPPVAPPAPARVPVAPTTVPATPAATPVAAAPEPMLEIRKILDVPAIGFGDWVWDERGAPPGRVVMTVDLRAQTISVFRGGHEIGTAAMLYGADDKPTPLGRFPILEKDRDHMSNLYDAPMPFMLRLTNDGVAIHGSDVKYGMATHGCIGVPTPFARKLFDAVKVGDMVVITRGKLLKLGDRIS